LIRRDHPGRDDMIGVRDHGLARHRDRRIEIARGQRVGEVAEVIDQERMGEGEIRARSRRGAAFVHFYAPLVLLDDHSDTGRRQHTAETIDSRPSGFARSKFPAALMDAETRPTRSGLMIAGEGFYLTRPAVLRAIRRSRPARRRIWKIRENPLGPGLN
jgi:hypothetical protein